MEGMPHVPMFSLELLTPDKPLSPQFEQCIREYIVMTYQDDPSKYNDAFRELEAMRKVAMQNAANVESICVLKRYFAQLALLKSRFPMEEGDPLATPFSWIDRGYDLSTAVTYNDVNFEMCCVLFNVGAAHALIAANEMRSDADSVKNAFMHFQYASWPMQHLRDTMRARNYSGMNFSDLYLTFYADMFLAQAQECILEKSIADGRKAVVVAKVAAQLKKYYESNLSMLSLLHTELTSIGRYKALFRLCAAKMELYDAISAFYLGVKAEADDNMGLRVSYFTYALERVLIALETVAKDERDGLRSVVQFAYDLVAKRAETARKENDFIYHARLTKPQDFDAVEAVAMVKPIPFDPNDASVCGEDLFAALLPTDVLKTVSLYSDEKTKFRRAIVEKAQHKDDELETYLMSLQLTQLHLDMPIESVRLPDELLSASAAFTAQPNAFTALMDKFDGITRMADDAERRLADLGGRIGAVAAASAELADDDGFRAIRAKVDELNGHHVKARQNNVELQRAIAAHSENLKLLAMPLTHITQEICGDFINPMEYPEGQQLRRVLDKVDEMRQQRYQLLQTLEEDLDADDITKRALADRDFHPQELFERALKRHEKLANVIQQNLIAQDNILSALTDANANFAEFRRRIVENNEKRALHSLTLVTAHNVFVDVGEKTDKAIAFYKQLFGMIDALAKGVAIIEETEEKKRKEAERLLTEKRAAKECAETLQHFGFGQQQAAVLPQRQTAAENVGAARAAFSPGLPSSTATPSYGGRPRLGDYMDYYRSKIAGQSARNGDGGVSTPEHAFRPISTGLTAVYAPFCGGETYQQPQPISAPVACVPVPGSYSVAPPSAGVQSSIIEALPQSQLLIPSSAGPSMTTLNSGQQHHQSSMPVYAPSAVPTTPSISGYAPPTFLPQAQVHASPAAPPTQFERPTTNYTSSVYGNGTNQPAYNGQESWPQSSVPKHTPALAAFSLYASQPVNSPQSYISSAYASTTPTGYALQPQMSTPQMQSHHFAPVGSSQPKPSHYSALVPPPSMITQTTAPGAVSLFGIHQSAAGVGPQPLTSSWNSPITPQLGQSQHQPVGAFPSPSGQPQPAGQPMNFTAGAAAPSPWHQNLNLVNPYAANSNPSNRPV